MPESMKFSAKAILWKWRCYYRSTMVSRHEICLKTKCLTFELQLDYQNQLKGVSSENTFTRKFSTDSIPLFVPNKLKYKTLYFINDVRWIRFFKAYKSPHFMFLQGEFFFWI